MAEKVIDIPKWVVIVGFSDTTTAAFESYAPMEDLVKDAGERIGSGLSAVVDRARKCNMGPYISLKCTVRTGPGSTYGVKTTAKPEALVEAAQACLGDAVKKSLAAQRRRLINPPPGLEERVGEFMETVAKLARHVPKVVAGAKVAAAVIPGVAAPASATAGMEAEMGAAATGPIPAGFDFSGIVKMGVDLIKSNPEIITQAQELIKDPSKLSAALSELSGGGD